MFSSRSSKVGHAIQKPSTPWISAYKSLHRVLREGQPRKQDVLAGCFAPSVPRGSLLAAAFGCGGPLAGGLDLKPHGLPKSRDGGSRRNAQGGAVVQNMFRSKREGSVADDQEWLFEAR